MSLLEQNITKKEQVNKNNATKLDIGDSKSSKYRIETIWNSAVYTKELKSDYFLSLYYLVF